MYRGAGVCSISSSNSGLKALAGVVEVEGGRAGSGIGEDDREIDLLVVGPEVQE